MAPMTKTKGKARQGKLKTGNKKQRWKKGFASSCNPTINKHRLEAAERRKKKNGMPHMQMTPTNNEEPSQLTPDVLAYIEKINSDDNTIKLWDVEEECKTIRDGIMQSEKDSQSAMTHVSGLTDTSMKTFSKVRDWFKRGLNTEKCVLYAAAGDIIKEARTVKSDEEGSIVEYFGMFVRMLQERDDLNDKDNIIHLLCMVAKSKDLSDGVVNDQFSVVSLLLDQILKVPEAPTSLMKNTVTCLCLLMGKLGDSKWTEDSCKDIFRSILKQVENPKPKVRQAAKEGVAKIVRSLWTLKGVRRHPVFSLTGEHCRDRMKSCTTARDDKKLCHLMTFMSEVMHTFESKHLGGEQKEDEQKDGLLDLIYSWLTKASDYQILGKTCLDTLSKMFEHRPDADHLPLSMNSQFLKALYMARPNYNNQESALKWLHMMGEAVTNLVENSNAAVGKEDRWNYIYHVSDFCDAAFKFLTYDTALCDGAHKTVQQVLISFGKLVHANKDEKVDKIERCIVKLAEKLEKILHKPTVQDLAFKYYEICFNKIITKDRIGLVEKVVLPQLSSLRNTNINDIFALDGCLGQAIATFGPEQIMEKLGVNTETIVDKHSWILPLFQQNVKNARLAHFFDVFLPMACQIQEKAKSLRSNELKSNANILYKQCWELLKSYCNNPQDLAAALDKKSICYKISKKGLVSVAEIENTRSTERYKDVQNNAQVLGLMLVSGDADLKEVIMESLRNLINSCQDLAPLKKFSMKFMNVLCNVYQSFDGDIKDFDVKSQTQLKALETIKHLCRICEQGELAGFATTVFQHIEDNEQACEALKEGKKISELKKNMAQMLCKYDILINLVVYLRVEDIEGCCNRVTPLFSSSNLQLDPENPSEPNLHKQKKAYRIFEEVCKSEKEGCRNFLQRNHQHIRNIFLDEKISENIFDPSRGPRFVCMESIVKLLKETNIGECKAFVVKIFPDCVQCLKDSKKAQETAFRLLQTCSFVYEDCLEDFFEVVFAGVEDESSIEFCARSIYALGRITHDHVQNMPVKLLDKTINMVFQKLASNKRQICNAAISFLFVVFSFGSLVLAKVYGPLVLTSMSKWNRENINHFRLKVKKILTKLVRRLGYKFVDRNISTGFRKQLDAIRKEQNREKKKDKKKDAGYESDEDDFKPSKKEGFDILDDLDSSSDEGEEPVRKKRRNDLIIEEDEDEVMDLLDASSSKLISTSAPKKKSNLVNLDKDGKIIVQLDEKDESDGDNCLQDIGLKKSTKKVLKKKQTKDDGDTSDEDDVRSKMSKMSVKTGKSTYKPGGKGIHRDVRDGSEYRGKKASGDMKKKNQKHQPYAYLPLNPAILNKRKAKKAGKGQFDAIVKSSRKGAAIGRKGKKRKHNN